MLCFWVTVCLYSLLCTETSGYKKVYRYYGGSSGSYGGSSSSSSVTQPKVIEMTAELQQKFVDAHNAVRKSVQPTAGNMLAVEWDHKIADVAEKFVKKCSFSHSESNDRTIDTYEYPLGENLFVGMSVSSDHTDPVYITNEWAAEKENYDFDTMSCTPGEMCGHYTQVVWADTNKIGCAIGQCPTSIAGTSSSMFDILVACNYGPTGNWAGDQPYKTGESCSACPSGTTTCKNDLLEPTLIHHHRHKKEKHSSSIWKPQKFSLIKLTHDMKKEFVNAHNIARSFVTPQAANMLALEWDHKIEKMAQRFVRKCKFAHSASVDRVMKGYDYPLGENLFVGMSLSKSHTDPSFIIDKWNEEQKDYNFDTATCVPGKMCGHYTQVVWATSHKIGCAIGKCPAVDVRGSKDNNYDILVACHYGPNGNFRGEQPYKAGDPCSACPSDMPTCSKRLCA